MILGVGALLDIVNTGGGIELMSNAISSVMNTKTAVPFMGVSAGLLSLVSSALGVVYPTMMPMSADIAAQIGGINPVALMAAVGVGGSLAGVSPLSTGGALILAALGTNTKDFNKAKQDKEDVYKRQKNSSTNGGLAQLGEHLPCKQGVASSRCV